jgi:hypothetical protein
MKRRTRLMLVLTAAITFALSFTISAGADDPQTCTWVGPKWVCVPPEEDP